MEDTVSYIEGVTPRQGNTTSTQIRIDPGALDDFDGSNSVSDGTLLSPYQLGRSPSETLANSERMNDVQVQFPCGTVFHDIGVGNDEFVTVSEYS